MKARALAVILAAGEGKRMNSILPKVLHRLAGQPLIEHVVQASLRAEMDRTVVVVGHRRDMVLEALHGYPIEFVLQEPQLGTGHAMQEVRNHVGSFHGTCLVLLGDAPFITPDTMSRLVGLHRQENNAATILTAQIDDPTGYGRIIRAADGQVERIVEHRDASESELAVREINSGIYCFQYAQLGDALAQLSADNDQSEYYLTDTIALMRAAGHRVGAMVAANPLETQGINDFRQLQEAEEQYAQRRQGARLPSAGDAGMAGSMAGSPYDDAAAVDAYGAATSHPDAPAEDDSVPTPGF